MIRKFKLMFPDESSIVVTFKDQDGTVQVGGNARFKDKMAAVLEDMFEVYDFEEMKTAYNKVIFRFKTTEKKFNIFLGKMEVFGITCNPISKIGRLIR